MPSLHKVSNEPHVWNKMLKDSLISNSRTSENFKAVTSLTTCPPQTRVQLSSFPSEIHFCSFIKTWFNYSYQNNMPALWDLHRQLRFVYFITTKPSSFFLVAYLSSSSQKEVTFRINKNCCKNLIFFSACFWKYDDFRQNFSLIITIIYEIYYSLTTKWVSLYTLY